MRYRFDLFLLATLTVMFLSFAYAAPNRIIENNGFYLVVEIDGQHLMGDADTPGDARRLAIEDAKRSASELAGTYLESETTVVDYEVSRDEITVLSAAYIQTEVVDRGRPVVNQSGQIVFNVRIKATVDKTDLKERIESYKSDPAAHGRLKQIQAENKALQSKLEELNKQLSVVGGANDENDRQRDERISTRDELLAQIAANLASLTQDLMKPSEVPLDRHSFRAALVEGDIEKIKKFSKNGWDFSQIHRPMHAAAGYKSEPLIVDVLHNNHSNIDVLIKELANYVDLRVNSPLDMPPTAYSDVMEEYKEKRNNEYKEAKALSDNLRERARNIVAKRNQENYEMELQRYDKEMQRFEKNIRKAHKEANKKLEDEYSKKVSGAMNDKNQKIRIIKAEIADLERSRRNLKQRKGEKISEFQNRDMVLFNKLQNLKVDLIAAETFDPSAPMKPLLYDLEYVRISHDQFGVSKPDKPMRLRVPSSREIEKEYEHLMKDNNVDLDNRPTKIKEVKSTLLIEAVRAGNLKAVKRLLLLGAKKTAKGYMTLSNGEKLYLDPQFLAKKKSIEM